jgi:hypothetical protein
MSFLFQAREIEEVKERKVAQRLENEEKEHQLIADFRNPNARFEHQWDQRSRELLNLQNYVRCVNNTYELFA